jgi:SAM-dependent methyltransferase
MGVCVRIVDVDGDAVETARDLSWGNVSGANAVGTDASLGTDAVRPSFVIARGETLPFRDDAFDAVLCLDVLHWMPGHAAFDAVWNEAWRVLGTGGTFVARLPCREAFPDAVALGDGRFRLATGAEWFLPDREALRARVLRDGGDETVFSDPDVDGRVLLVACHR